MMIKRGDRVKLTARVAAAFNNNKRPGRFDWNDRRGVIERISANKVSAFVLWEGRKTPDEIPIHGIERIDWAGLLDPKLGQACSSR
jgi:hypothetical protein